MFLTVLNVAYPLAPVGPDAVGGAEQVLTALDHALTRAGHRSIVVACAGSEAAGLLVETPRICGPLDHEARRHAHRMHKEAIARARREFHIDLIHMHGVDFPDYLPDEGIPVLLTLHLPPAWYPQQVFHLRRGQTYLQCVSESQRRACPASPALAGVIANGVDLERLRPARKRAYTAALGRICPEKGFEIAARAARAAGVPFVLAGEVFGYDAHVSYFRETLDPVLRSSGGFFIGRVGLVRKRRLLAGARCLLAPSLAPETSSLVAMEALACGTPVIAFPCGALPEIVEHGKTGFLVTGEKEMADAIGNVPELSPEDCRSAAQTRFSAARMAREYLDLYARIVQQSRPGMARVSTLAGALCPNLYAPEPHGV